VSFH
jgi:hypothetical protein